MSKAGWGGALRTGGGGGKMKRITSLQGIIGVLSTCLSIQSRCIK